MCHLVKKCAPHFTVALVLFHIDSDDLPFPIAQPHRVWHGPDYKPILGQSSLPVLAVVTSEDGPEPFFSPSPFCYVFLRQSAALRCSFIVILSYEDIAKGVSFSLVFPTHHHPPARFRVRATLEEDRMAGFRIA
jgi:hypothetical protein